MLNTIDLRVFAPNAMGFSQPIQGSRQFFFSGSLGRKVSWRGGIHIQYMGLPVDAGTVGNFPPFPQTVFCELSMAIKTFLPIFLQALICWLRMGSDLKNYPRNG